MSFPPANIIYEAQKHTQKSLIMLKELKVTFYELNV